MIRVEDHGRVRVLTLDRPEAKNAFNEALYDATTEALIAAADDPGVAVVVITGTGDAFSAGTDIVELARRTKGELVPGVHGFPGLLDQLIEFPKPLLCAINGVGVGIGATIVGLADLVFMSSTARLKCPFTSLGVAPEAGSSFTFPELIGRQRATWALLSSEWLSAEECLDMGLVFEVCEPDDLLPTTMRRAEVLASKPITSLIASKNVIVEPRRAEIRAARRLEDAAFAQLLGGEANAEALAAFVDGRGA